MTLTVTSGDAAADSYASLAEANAYFSARGLTTWTGTDAVKENALRRAASYLDNQYRIRWRGLRTNDTQALAWPRSDGSRDPYRTTLLYPLLDLDGIQIAVDTIPQQVKNAQCEAALLILTGVDLEPTLTRGGLVKSIGKSVGPLRKDIVYMDGAGAIDRYTAIEGLLRGLVTGTPGSSSGVVGIMRA